MAKRKFRQGEPPKEFAPVPEGWYFGKIVDVREEDLPRGPGIRRGYAFEITDGQYAGRWVWLNIFMSDFIMDQRTGEKITPSHYRARKLQADIDPKGHPLVEAGPGEAVDFELEDAEWFLGAELAIQVVHREYTNKEGRNVIADEVKGFCPPDEIDKAAERAASRGSSRSSRAPKPSDANSKLDTSHREEEDDLPF